MRMIKRMSGRILYLVNVRSIKKKILPQQHSTLMKDVCRDKLTIIYFHINKDRTN